MAFAQEPAIPDVPGDTVRIARDRAVIDTENGLVDLGLGTAVIAEIKTGRRRVIDYLLSLLVRYRKEGPNRHISKDGEYASQRLAPVCLVRIPCGNCLIPIDAK
jgi:hypothetical protein